MVAIKKYRPSPEECVRMEGHCWEYHSADGIKADGIRICKHCGWKQKKVPESWVNAYNGKVEEEIRNEHEVLPPEDHALLLEACTPELKKWLEKNKDIKLFPEEFDEERLNAMEVKTYGLEALNIIKKAEAEREAREAPFDATKITLGNWEPMLKCRKKPIVVHATQLNFPEGFIVATKEGVMTGKPGDYLMIGVEGEKYPCSKEIFEKTYDVIADDEDVVDASQIKMRNGPPTPSKIKALLEDDKFERGPDEIVDEKLDEADDHVLLLERDNVLLWERVGNAVRTTPTVMLPNEERRYAYLGLMIGKSGKRMIFLRAQDPDVGMTTTVVIPFVILSKFSRDASMLMVDGRKERCKRCHGRGWRMSK